MALAASLHHEAELRSAAVRPIRMAVVSDLHAFDGDVQPAPSTLKIDAQLRDPAAHPIVALERLIADLGARADVVLCPGDMGDRASKAGIQYGWDMVHRVARALRGAEVIATVGNHDVTSRPEQDALAHDPLQTLTGLVPLFPYDDRRIQQRFFSEHFAIVNGPGWRVITVNSSAHHAYGGRAYDYGRVAPNTWKLLLSDLQELGPCPVNVLLCHHHPIEFTDVDEHDRSTIVGGSLVLGDLQGGDLGSWVVVHGHKHLPYLGYGPGSSAAPVIFAAGSLSASLQLHHQSRTRNQFYLIEFDPQAAAAVQSCIAGRFNSWYWVHGSGWEPTPPGSGLPARGGFGFRTDARRLAARICSAMERNGHLSVDWDTLVTDMPELEFLIPSDLEHLAVELKMRDWRVVRDFSGRLGTVSQPAL